MVGSPYFEKRAVSAVRRCGGVARLLVGGAEQQRDAPQARQAHQGVDDAGENGHLAAAEESHRIKAEQADPPQFRAPMIASANAILSITMRKTSFMPSSRDLALVYPTGRELCGWGKFPAWTKFANRIAKER